MSNDTPQYGSYPPPIRPENSGGTATTNPSSEQPILPTRAPAAKKKRSALLVGLAVLLVALIVGGIFAFRNATGPAAATPAATSTTKAPTVLEAAAKACALSATPEDLGHTLTLSNVSAKEDPGPDDWDHAQCLFHELHVPASVEDHIGQTRAMDGMQDDSWDGMKARWNYHPDHGMNITFTDAK